MCCKLVYQIEIDYNAGMNVREKMALQNRLLIATPQVQDKSLQQVVIYVRSVDEQLVNGIILNKPSQSTFSDLLKMKNITFDNQTLNERFVLSGGPVERETGLILHLSIESDKNPSFKGVDISVDQMLEAIATGNEPSGLLISLGRILLETDRLLSELMSDNYWLIAPLCRDVIFDTPHSMMWRAAALSIGVDFNCLPVYSGHA